MFLLKSDTVSVLAVLPRYPWYYRGNGYKFYSIVAVLGSKYAGVPWGWGPGLQYYHGYGALTKKYVGNSQLRDVLSVSLKLHFVSVTVQSSKDKRVLQTA